MTRSGRAASAGLVVLLCTLLPGEGLALRLLAVEPRERAGGTEVVLRLDEAPRGVEIARLPERRLVIDLPGATTALGSARIAGRGPCLTRVRIGEHPGFTRVVLDLSSECPYERRIEDRAVVIDLGTPGASAAAPPGRRTRASGVLLPGAEPLPGARARTGVLLPEIGTPPEPAAAAPTEASPEYDRAVSAVEAPSEPGAAEPAREEAPGPDLASKDAPTAAPAPRDASTADRDAGAAAPPSPEDAPGPAVTAAPLPAATAIRRGAATVTPAPAAAPATAAPTPRATAARPARSLRPVEIEAPPSPAAAAAAPARPSPAAAGTAAGGGERDAARVSIDFQDADVRTVLDLLARAGGRQVIFRPEVEGRVAIQAVDEPWREVFDRVLQRARLEAVEHDGLFLVAPARR